MGAKQNSEGAHSTPMSVPLKSMINIYLDNYLIAYNTRVRYYCHYDVVRVCGKIQYTMFLY